MRELYLRIQINRIFNIDIVIFQKINIDIDIAWAIYCSINILAIYCHQFFNIDIAARWKTNIDIGNINILLQYIVQQYIDLYPWDLRAQCWQAVD